MVLCTSVELRKSRWPSLADLDLCDVCVTGPCGQSSISRVPAILCMACCSYRGAYAYVSKWERKQKLAFARCKALSSREALALGKQERHVCKWNQLNLRERSLRGWGSPMLTPRDRQVRLLKTRVHLLKTCYFEIIRSKILQNFPQTRSSSVVGAAPVQFPSWIVYLPGAHHAYDKPGHKWLAQPRGVIFADLCPVSMCKIKLHRILPVQTSPLIIIVWYKLTQDPPAGS